MPSRKSVQREQRQRLALAEGQLNQQFPDSRRELEAMAGKAGADRYMRRVRMAIDDEVVVGCDRVGACCRTQHVAGYAVENMACDSDDLPFLGGGYRAVDGFERGFAAAAVDCDLDAGLAEVRKAV